MPSSESSMMMMILACAMIFVCCMPLAANANPLTSPESSRLNYLHTMPIPSQFHVVNRTFHVSGVSFGTPTDLSPLGLLYIVSKSTQTAGVYAYDLLSGNMTRLMGAVEGTLGCVEDPNEAVTASYPVSPNGIDVINPSTAIFADGMPSSRIFLLSTPNVWTPLSQRNMRVSTLVGAPCNFTQKNMTENAAASDRSNAIGPPTYVKYIASRDVLLFTQSTFVAAVQNDTMTVFFGSQAEKGRKNDTGLYTDSVHRTSARTRHPAQMDVLEDSLLYVAEEGMGTVREIDLDTGMSRVVLGSPPMNETNDTYIWPPPSSCTKEAPCSPVDGGILLVAPTSIAVFAPNGSSVRWLFVGDLTEAVIYKVDLKTNLAYKFYGEMLQSGSTDGDIYADHPRHKALHQFAVSNDTLFIADGQLRSVKVLSDSDRVDPDVPLSAPMQPEEVCSLIDDCSGRGTEVEGVPAVKCQCTCRTGWVGEQCEEREAWNKITETMSMALTATQDTTDTDSDLTTTEETTTDVAIPTIPETNSTETSTEHASDTAGTTNEYSSTTTATDEVVLTTATATHNGTTATEENKTETRDVVPQPVKDAAKVTVVASTIVIGLVSNPTLGVQASRATLLFKISKCAQKFDEPLDFATSALQLSIGDGDMRFFYGAVFGNLAVILGFCAVHIIVAFIYSKRQNFTTTESLGKLRFPSLEVLPISLLLEGTVMCAFVLMYHGGYTNTTQKLIGGLALALVIITMMACTYYLVFNFRCTFHPFSKADRRRSADPTKQRGTAAVSDWGKILRWLMHGSGKWVEDEGSLFRRRFAALFVEYRAGVHYFVLFEFSMSIISGVLEAVMPGEDSGFCFPLLITCAAVFCVFFACVLILRPNNTRFSLSVALAISGLQAGSAVCLVIFALTRDGRWETTSSSLALAAIYVLAVKTLLDLIELIGKVAYWCTKQVRTESISEKTNGTSLGEPLLNGARVDTPPPEMTKTTASREGDLEMRVLTVVCSDSSTSLQRRSQWATAAAEYASNDSSSWSNSFDYKSAMTVLASTEDDDICVFPRQPRDDDYYIALRAVPIDEKRSAVSHACIVVDDKVPQQSEEHDSTLPLSVSWQLVRAACGKKGHTVTSSAVAHAESSWTCYDSTWAARYKGPIPLGDE